MYSLFHSFLKQNGFKKNVLLSLGIEPRIGCLMHKLSATDFCNIINIMLGGMVERQPIKLKEITHL